VGSQTPVIPENVKFGQKVQILAETSNNNTTMYLNWEPGRAWNGFSPHHAAVGRYTYIYIIMYVFLSCWLAGCASIIIEKVHQSHISNGQIPAVPWRKFME
jgi:hypothetical protein